MLVSALRSLLRHDANHLSRSLLPICVTFLWCPGSQLSTCRQKDFFFFFYHETEKKANQGVRKDDNIRAGPFSTDLKELCNGFCVL